MSVRLFLLGAMTVAFGLLWSSDQQYQDIQVALAASQSHGDAAIVARAKPRAEYALNYTSVADETSLQIPQIRPCPAMMPAIAGADPVVGEGVVEVLHWGNRAGLRVQAKTDWMQSQLDAQFSAAGKSVAGWFGLSDRWRQILEMMNRAATQPVGEAAGNMPGAGSLEVR